MLDFTDLAVATEAVYDPATSAADLAAIAQHQPVLQPQVAIHPNAYAGLLDWLSQYGTDVAKRAVTARREDAVRVPTAVDGPAGVAAVTAGAQTTSLVSHETGPAEQTSVRASVVPQAANSDFPAASLSTACSTPGGSTAGSTRWVSAEDGGTACGECHQPLLPPGRDRLDGVIGNVRGVDQLGNALTGTELRIAGHAARRCLTCGAANRNALVPPVGDVAGTTSVGSSQPVTSGTPALLAAEEMVASASLTRTSGPGASGHTGAAVAKAKASRGGGILDAVLDGLGLIKSLVIGGLVVAAVIAGIVGCSLANSAKSVTCAQFSAMSSSQQISTVKTLLSAHGKDTGNSNVTIATMQIGFGCMARPGNTKIDTIPNW